MPKTIGLDIGGSLVKGIIMYSSASDKEYTVLQAPVGQLKAFLDQLRSEHPHARLSATGGGSHKYRNLIQAHWTSVQFQDEMACIWAGTCASGRTDLLVANVGTGISFVQGDGVENFCRVGGTAVGGGTFLGLARALTGVYDFADLVQLAREGSMQSLNVLVGDIYGTDYLAAGLEASVVASFLGKISSPGTSDVSLRSERSWQADAVLSILTLVCQNLAQLAVLYASRTGKAIVCFSGGMVDGISLVQEILAAAVERFSASRIRASFPSGSLYATAVGAARLWREGPSPGRDL